MEKTLNEALLLYSELGDVPRGIRQRQGRTLREISSEAQISLGYLSEVKHGQKEVSSEPLEAITSALRVPLWFVLREVSEHVAIIDDVVISDTVPDDTVSVMLISRRVKYSEFYEVIEVTFGSALGRSYTSDLYLASLGATAFDVLFAGANPDAVWAMLCEETGCEDTRWIHRVDLCERGR